MKRRHPLKVLFYISLTIVVLLIGYKAYLNLFTPEFEAEQEHEGKQHRERDKALRAVQVIPEAVGKAQHLACGLELPALMPAFTNQVKPVQRA